VAVARSPDYAVNLVVDGQECLVVGGGEVAARKVEGLTTCGARVSVVAPRTVPAIDRLARSAPDGLASVVVERRPYREGEAGRFRLVVTATGIPEVDRAVARDARAAGIWVNSADDAEACSFLLPSIHREGPVTVAVSTGGASPALAAWLRRRLARDVGPEVALMAELLEEARRSVRADGRSTEDVDWAAVLDGTFPELVAAGDLAGARAVLRSATARPGGRTEGPGD
jgi:precorrin-2 dehydrogenase